MRYFHQTLDTDRRWSQSLSASIATVYFVPLLWQTEEEVGRQHQGMDSPGVRQDPEGSGEQGKVEETGCEIVCGASTKG